MEIILASATIIGGLSAIWFFGEKLFSSICFFWKRLNGVKKTSVELNGENDDFFCSVAGIPYSFVPAQIDDLRWIAEIDNMVFHGIDAMPFKVLKKWYIANKDSFVIVRGCEGKYYGYLIILPLKNETLVSRIRSAYAPNIGK